MGWNAGSAKSVFFYKIAKRFLAIMARRNKEAAAFAGILSRGELLASK